MTDWRTNMAALRAKRAAALDAGDVSTLRTMLLRAAVFARLTVQCPTAMAERDYTEFVATNDITNRFLRNGRMDTIDAIRNFVANLDVTEFRRYVEDESGWSLAYDLEAQVRGLGCAKASFASALFGGTGTYCVDVWGTRYAAIVCGLVDGDVNDYRASYRRNDATDSHGKGCDCNHHKAEWLRDNWRGSVRNRWEVYHAVGSATFADAEGQWAFFESADPVFAATGHEAFFREVL